MNSLANSLQSVTVLSRRRRPSQQTFVDLQDVLKTSSTRLQRNNFSSSKTSSRRLQDISQNILKTSSRRLGRRKIVTLKTSSRRLGDKQNIYWGISVSNKSKCVSNKSTFHKSISDESKANPKCCKPSEIQLY